MQRVSSDLVKAKWQHPVLIRKEAGRIKGKALKLRQRFEFMEESKERNSYKEGQTQVIN